MPMPRRLINRVAVSHTHPNLQCYIRLWHQAAYIIFMANLDAALDKDTTLTVSFSNPNDGIQVFYAYPMQGSAFRSPRFAPETGYATHYVMTRRMDDRSLYDDAAWEDLNYIFRVRTKCDAQGYDYECLVWKNIRDVGASHKWGKRRLRLYLLSQPHAERSQSGI